MRYTDMSDAECAIGQALGVVGDPWTLLVLRDITTGIHRFDALQAELGVSRKVLTERLGSLLESGVLERRLYQPNPPRYEYHLTDKGHGLAPVLIALQDWGARFVLGDGSLSGSSGRRSAEARRVHRLVGTRLPELTLTASTGRRRDPVSSSPWTVLYCYPGAYATPAGYPQGWSTIPGAKGCTLESITYRERLPDFARRGATVVGVSTQRPDEQRAFAKKERLPFPLLSDQDLELAAALRLPTFRAAGADRLKRLTLLVSKEREISGVLYPVPDATASVTDALALLPTP